jgi:hypothetical protein
LIGASVVMANQRRRWPVRSLAAVTALVVAGTVAYAITRTAPVVVTSPVAPPPAAARVAPPPANPAHTEPAPPPPAPAKIRIQITSRPSDASVLLDGKKIGRTPFDGTVDAAPGKHEIKLRRPRYATQRLDVTLDADITHDVTLARGR